MNFLLSLIASIGLLVVPPTDFPLDDLRLNMKQYNTSLQAKKTELVSLSEDLAGFKGKVTWNDLVFINSTLRSGNNITTVLYYQLELGHLFEEMAVLSPELIPSKIPRIIEQLDFTRSRLRIEFERILFQYAQIVDFTVLIKIEELRITIKETIHVLDEYIRYLESRRMREYS